MDIAPLGFGIDSSGAVKASGDLDRMTAAAKRADVAADSLGASSRGAVAGVAAVGTAASKASGGVKVFGQIAGQMSFQIQDFFVQMASGQSLFTAFAQQAPQAAGAFTLLGGRLGAAIPVIGTFIAVGAAFAPMLLDMGEKAKSAEDRIDDLQDAMRNFRGAANEAGASAEDLREKYGDLAATVRDALTAKLQTAAYDAQQALGSALKDVGSEFQNALANLGRSGDRVSFQAARNAASTLAEDYKLSADEALRLKAAFDELESAEGPAATATAAEALRKELLAAYGTMQDMPAAVAAIYRQLPDVVSSASLLSESMNSSANAGVRLAGLDIASGIAAGANEAIRLATALSAAAVSFGNIGKVGVPGMGNARLSFSGGNGGTYRTAEPGDGLAPNSNAPTSSRRPERRSLEAMDNYYRAISDAAEKAAKAAGKKRGKTEGEKEAERSQREVERLYESLMTPAEKFNARVKELEDLRAGGFFTEAVGGTETFNRAMQDARKDMEDAAWATNDVGKAFSDMFTGLVGETENKGQVIVTAFSNILTTILNDMTAPHTKVLGNAASDFLQGLLPKPGVGGVGAGVAGGGIGGFFRNLFSFDGGGYTGSGSRTGGIDGKGGMPAIVHPNESWIDHTKGQRMAQAAPQSVHVTASVDPNNGNIIQVVQKTAGQMDARMSRAQAKAAPRLNADNARRRITQ